MFNITVNGQSYYTNAEQDTPLLWVLREELGLSGTKFGCGRGICGACSIHINGEAIRSCQIRVEDAVGKTITTIEGLAKNGKMHPMQEAFKKHHGLQCGFCTPCLLYTSPSPRDGLLSRMPSSA